MSQTKGLTGIEIITNHPGSATVFDLTLAFESGATEIVTAHIAAVEQMLSALAQLVTTVRESQKGTTHCWLLKMFGSG